MRDGFVKCAAMIPSIKVADCANNEAEIIRLIDEAATSGAKVVVFRNYVSQVIRVAIYFAGQPS